MTATAADYRACGELLRTGSKSFHAAAILLPAARRRAASAVYAWCRLGDHAVDLSPSPAAELDRLQAQLARIYRGRPEGPVERAFADVAHLHDIPRAVPEALLQGFQWDAEGRRYESLAELCAYCARVGSTVGVMMALVMGRRDEQTLLGACVLGVAMQLTNVARDVGEDAARKRIYLPLDWLRPTGWSPEIWLTDPMASAAVRDAVRRTLRVADALYARAWPDIGRLPRRCRPAIRAASLVYADIGDRIRLADCDSVTRRAFTGRRRKLLLLGRALGSSMRPSRAAAAARTTVGGAAAEGVATAEAQSRFLVDAAIAG